MMDELQSRRFHLLNERERLHRRLLMVKDNLERVEIDIAREAIVNVLAAFEGRRPTYRSKVVQKARESCGIPKARVAIAMEELEGEGAVRTKIKPSDGKQTRLCELVDDGVVWDDVPGWRG